MSIEDKKIKLHLYYLKNRKKIIIRSKLWCKKNAVLLKLRKKKNKEKIKQYNLNYHKKYYKKNYKPILLYVKKYHKKNKKRLQIHYREYREKNKKILYLRDAFRRIINAKKIKKMNKKYRMANRDKKNIREVLLRNNNLSYRILCNLRRRIYHAIKRNSKSQNTHYLIGCDLEFLISYLQNKFRDGMTWKNYGKYWHIDHIIPCAYFNFTKSSHQKKCFHYTNLQPLLAFENCSKGKKINCFNSQKAA